MTKNHEVELNANLVFGSKNNPNNKCNVFIKTKSADIDEIFEIIISFNFFACNNFIYFNFITFIKFFCIFFTHFSITKN